MNEQAKGQVVPFHLSGQRMRKRAKEYRRCGQVAEALVLLRRAAEQDDQTFAWQSLAAELRQMQCWEAAEAILARVLSRGDHAPSAWLEMAQCQAALGREELTEDCLMHLLQEDPWSPEGETARGMLAAKGPGEPEPGRTKRLIRRGIRAFMDGDTALGERRIRRAARMTNNPERLMITMAMMHTMRLDLAGTARWLGKALRLQGGNPQALCSLSVVFNQMGRPRRARAFLQKAMDCCMDACNEEQFLTTAWGQDAWLEMDGYLAMRSARAPHRTALMTARAAMLNERGDRDGAMQQLQRALGIDPMDRRALTLMAWLRTGEARPGLLPDPSLLPYEIVREQQEQLKMLAGQEDLFRYGSQGRLLLEWFAASSDMREQALALDIVMRHPDQWAASRFMQEMLARPGIQPESCRRILIHLTEAGFTEPLLMHMGNRYVVASCRRTEPERPEQAWHTFLRLLLRETRHQGRSTEIAHFAALAWGNMTPAQRQDAAGRSAMLWCRTIELMWLRMAGEEDLAAQLIINTDISTRRLARAMRQLGSRIQNDTDIKEKENDDEVH